MPLSALEVDKEVERLKPESRPYIIGLNGRTVGASTDQLHRSGAPPHSQCRRSLCAYNIQYFAHGGLGMYLAISRLVQHAQPMKGPSAVFPSSGSLSCLSYPQNLSLESF